MAEGSSRGCCAPVALVVFAGAKALLPARCLGRGLRCPGSPVRQQTSGSCGRGPRCGDPRAVIHLHLVACPYRGDEAAGGEGDIPTHLNFSEWRGTPQTEYWGGR